MFARINSLQQSVSVLGSVFFTVVLVLASSHINLPPVA